MTWVRTFFKEDCTCDTVKKNMRETFNALILASRHKSIIATLEEIRRKIMTINMNLIKFDKTWICDIPSMARLILEENTNRVRSYKVL